jgi:transcriptional regulator with XRE-family HTH domain
MPPIPKPKRQRQPTFLREWREHRQLTQEQLAERIGISQPTLGRIERGKVPYNQDFLEAAAEALATDAASLIMRNPLQEDAIWSVWEGLGPAERQQAIAVIKALKHTGT